MTKHSHFLKFKEIFDNSYLMILLIAIISIVCMKIILNQCMIINNINTSTHYGSENIYTNIILIFSDLMRDIKMKWFYNFQISGWYYTIEKIWKIQIYNIQDFFYVLSDHNDYGFNILIQYFY